MSISPLNNLSSYLQSVLGTTQTTGSTTSATSSGGTGSVSNQSDNTQLSPFAELMSTLQQLEQSDPTKYAQVTGQIATNLQSAAKTAQANGNTTAANQLNQLATDFTNASTSGQLPNVQDLAQAVGGGGHHHHHHFHAESSNSSSSSSITGSTSTSSPLDQLLAAFQTNLSQASALNPMAIIQSTLSSAGIGTSNS